MIIRTTVIEVTDILKNSKSKLIQTSLKENKRIFGIKLEKFSGLLGYEIQPNRRIGTELADLVKRFGLKGILHSDELPKYGITQEEVNLVKDRLKCSNQDAFILIIAETYDKAKFIFERIIERLNEMIQKVPKDTRNANPDGTTSFLRPQPGSARMYPETDHPLIYVDRKVEDKGWYEKIIYNIKYGWKDIELKLVRLKERSIKNYMKLKETEKESFILDSLDPEFRKEILRYLGYNEKQIEDIIWSEYIDIFEKYAREVKPSFLCYLIFQLPSLIKKKYGVEPKIDERFIEDIIRIYKEGKITRDAIPKISYYYTIENKDVNTIIKEHNLFKISGEELEKKVQELINKYKDLEPKKLRNKILNELREIADPREIMEILNKLGY